MAFKNPFGASSSMGQIFNTVMSSIPKTESYMWTVRKEKQQKYATMKVVAHADLLKIYTSDEKGKVFECVLQGPADSPDVFSLFRLNSEDDALARFILLHQYLQPFFNITDKLYDITALQRLSDLARKPGDYSPAHVAVLVQMNEALKGPEVYKHINSQKCPEGKTPLLLAVESKSLQSMNELLDCGAVVDIPDDNGDTVFHYAARVSGFGSQVMKTLPHTKKLLNWPNKLGQTALLVACKEGNFDVAIMLVKAGATADTSDDIGNPIHYALKKCNLSAAQAIFEEHRNQGKAVCSKHGATPLHWAKSAEFISLVLEQEYDINAVSKSGDTALSIMIQRDRPKCALTLLTWDADPNIRDGKWNTPLHHAVKHKDLHTIHYLIAFGAEVNVVNNAGESPRHLAATDLYNTIGGMMGMNSEVIYALHGVGAKRCPPGTKGCQGGCKHGGHYDGVIPKTDLDEIDSGAKVYDQYLNDCIEEMRVAASTRRPPPAAAGRDSTDSAMDTSDAGDPSQRRGRDTVLCLDGGGIKGLILTELLLALEEFSGRKITEMFDWIVGTSTGGILAIALSQGFTVKECRKLYIGLKDEVFVGGRPYNSRKFENFLQQAFGSETLLNKHEYPRILVSGTLGDRSPPALHLFRNFDPPDTSSAWIAANQPPFRPVEKPSEQLAWKAARCSGAAPTYFKPMGCFLDGGLIANNPTLDALTEIHEFYMHKKSQGEPQRKIGAVVSLGTGVSVAKPIAHVDIVRPNSALDLISAATSIVGGTNLIDIIIEQVSESRMRSVDRARAWCHSIGTPFFRFSPPLSKDVALDEARDGMIGQMLYETRRYISQNRDKLKQLSDHIASLDVCR